MEWAKVSAALEAMATAPSAPKRRSLLSSLLKQARASGDVYAVMRILLPKRNRLRPHYQMKEAALASCLVQVLGLATTSNDGRQLLMWKTSAGSASGDLSVIASKVVSIRQQQQTKTICLTDFHSLLDRLATCSLREEKVLILRDLTKGTTAQQVKWIVRLILQDLKIGIGEKIVLDAFHPDANALMAHCFNLELVCKQLTTPGACFIHKELSVGKALKSQHSKRFASIDSVWDSMRGKCIVAECKFDGDRMQVHKDGDHLYFWSRNGKEHSEYNTALGPLLLDHIQSERCVLDGELLVWDCLGNRFKQRSQNTNRDAARAARKGWDTEELLGDKNDILRNVSSLGCAGLLFELSQELEMEMLIRARGLGTAGQLSPDKGSVLHLSLKDRHILLKSIVKPCHPYIVCILPGVGVGDGVQWSILPTTRDELFRFFGDTVQRGDEGIIVKDMESQWSPDNRDGRWCKLKPDYLNLGSDLDLLIIGGYCGSGQKGGQIVSYLLAVKDQPEPGVLPSRKNRKGGHPPTNCGYQVTGNRYECPDVWVSSPEKSVVLNVSAEKRVYASCTFKVGWTFRFPRAEKLRDDKYWHDCLSLQEFQEMVELAKANGNMMGKYAPLPCSSKVCKKRKARTGSSNQVLAHLRSFDVLHIPQLSAQLQGLVFYICNTGTNGQKENLQAQIKQAGGTTVMNLHHSVTHVIASQPTGIHYKAAVSSNWDVINLEWLESCIHSKELMPINPRHYFHMSKATKENHKDDIDSYGDPYFNPIDVADIHKILAKVGDGPPLLPDIRQMIKKILPKSGHWALFQGICLYLVPPIHSTNPDTQAVTQATLKRLGLEATWVGGSVSSTLHEAVTHVVVFTTPETPVFLQLLLSSIQVQEQRELLEQSGVNIVSHVWLQDCLQQQCILSVATYSLRFPRDSLVLGEQGAACYMTPDAEKNVCRTESTAMSLMRDKPMPGCSPTLTEHLEDVKSKFTQRMHEQQDTLVLKPKYFTAADPATNCMPGQPCSPYVQEASYMDLMDEQQGNHLLTRKRHRAVDPAATVHMPNQQCSLPEEVPCKNVLHNNKPTPNQNSLKDFVQLLLPSLPAATDHLFSSSPDLHNAGSKSSPAVPASKLEIEKTQKPASEPKPRFSLKSFGHLLSEASGLHEL